MSGDFSDPFEEPNMEITIQTLAGTSFEMKVHPYDTVLHIKNKICRVEGIPVHQQNLIYRLKELDDYSTLTDSGVINGSILRLVLNMRGGPISTRRLPPFDHRIAWRELRDLLESARDDSMENGHKISLLVFKEGDMVNLLRIIENGSYAPYSETQTDDVDENVSVLFDKLVEDNEMLRKISKVRKKIESVSTRRHLRNSRPTEAGASLAVAKLTEDETSDDEDDEDFSKLTLNSKCVGQERVMCKVVKDVSEEKVAVPDSTFKVFVNDPPSELEEIALKEKHRSRKDGDGKPKSVYSESKGAFSLTRERYLNTHPPRFIPENPVVENFDDFVEDEKLLQATCNEVLNNATNEVQFTRLVLPDNLERPKSAQKAALEAEKDRDTWDVSFLKIKKTYVDNFAPKRLKNVSFSELLRYQRNLEKDIDEPPEEQPEMYHKTYCHQFPHYMAPQPSSPVAPPRFAANEEQMCDYWLGNPNHRMHRSPLYGRGPEANNGESNMNAFNKISNAGMPSMPILPCIRQVSPSSFPSGASNIERLRNDYTDKQDSLDSDSAIEEVCGFYNMACSIYSNKSPDKIGPKPVLSPLQLKTSDDGGFETGTVDLQSITLDDLPAIKKKQLRCDQCNKRLNITNNYTCRCGRLFCAQHRYSEVHNCKFDYKTEGRVILERQNPLVVAEKLRKF